MTGPRIAHIIGDLNGFGGTEATLFRYLRNSEIPLTCQRVYVLRGTGTGDTLGAQMLNAGVDVRALNQRGGLKSMLAILELWREIKAFRPDIISGWLYVPALLATLFSVTCRVRPGVFWHIRSLPSHEPFKKPFRYMAQRALAVLSRLTRPQMVSNSEAAVAAHIAIGFSGREGAWAVIDNGIDIAAYYPDHDDATAVRAELGIPGEAIILGCVGRAVPEKGYVDFFSAIALMLSRCPALLGRVYVVVVGNGAEADNSEFYEMASRAIEPSRLRLLGRRADVPRILRAFDVFALPSRSESFPNALVEAMATGVACVATDVGQCRDVLGMPEFISPSANAIALAITLERILRLDKQELTRIGARNRQQVAERFVLKKMIESFDAQFGGFMPSTGSGNGNIRKS